MARFGARRMVFLIHLNAKKGAKAHIWTGDDTACRAWSLSMKSFPALSPVRFNDGVRYLQHMP
jgi:hypothetical protein